LTVVKKKPFKTSYTTPFNVMGLNEGKMMKNYLQEVFKEFDAAMINDLVSISKMETYKKDAILFFEGEEAKRLYCLAQGSLYEYKSERLQTVQAVRYFKPVTLIGETSIINKTSYPVSVKCDEDSKIISIDFDMYMQLFCFDKNRGRLGYAYLLDSVVQKYEHHINDCCYSCTQTRHFGADKRVAKYIYENLDTFNNDKKWKSAQLMRISPETLSRAINRLKKKELIQTQSGKLTIPDMQKMFEYIFD